jgi:hypothetical protein
MGMLLGTGTAVAVGGTAGGALGAAGALLDGWLGAPEEHADKARANTTSAKNTFLIFPSPENTFVHEGNKEKPSSIFVSFVDIFIRTSVNTSSWGILFDLTGWRNL